MRKVFWCSLASGVMLAGGVFTVAHFAARHPQSVVGRAIITAGQVAATASPLGGIAPFVGSFERAPQEAEVEVPQAGDAEQAEEMQPVPEAHGAIVIPEVEPVCQHPEFEQLVEHLVETIRHPNAVECPAGKATDASDVSAVMPYCKDHEECEEHAAEVATETCETLPMPSIEPEGEEQEDSATGSPATIETSKPVEPMPNYSPYHSGGCTRGGQGMYCPAGHSCQPCQPTTPAVEPKVEQPSEPTPPESGMSALREIHHFSIRGLDEAVATHPDIDTMEFRKSDGQLYDYGPGAL